MKGPDRRLFLRHRAVPRPRRTGYDEPSAVAPSRRGRGGVGEVAVADRRRRKDGGAVSGRNEVSEVALNGRLAGAGVEEVAWDQTVGWQERDPHSGITGRLDEVLVKRVPLGLGFDHHGTVLGEGIRGDGRHRSSGRGQIQVRIDASDEIRTHRATPSLGSPGQGVLDQQFRERRRIARRSWKGDGRQNDRKHGLHEAGRLEYNTIGATTPTPQRPEEILVLATICSAKNTIGRDNLELENSINPEAILSGQKPMAAVHQPATGSSNRRRRATDVSDVSLVGEAKDFVKVDTSASGDRVIRVLGAAPGWNEGSIVTQMPEFTGP